jgi:hypothetical protein
MGKYSVTSLVSTQVTKRKNNRCIREELNSLRHVPQIFLRERVVYGEMLEQEAERVFVMNYDTPWPNMSIDWPKFTFLSNCMFAPSYLYWFCATSFGHRRVNEVTRKGIRLTLVILNLLRIHRSA